MLTITRCFSTLIASGNGKRCIELRNILHETLLAKDINGQIKSVVFKNNTDKNAICNISVEVASKIDHLYSDIDDYFFINDLVHNG